jgi:AraC-like DNA-binding protein
MRITGKMRDCLFQAAELAKSLGLGERTFHRVVIQSLGIPPGRWLRMERAAAAMVRLRAGCKVKELAEEFGFRHQGDFSAEFKRWHGVLPSEYQAKVRHDSQVGNSGDVQDGCPVKPGLQDGVGLLILSIACSWVRFVVDAFVIGQVCESSLAGL